MLSAQRSLWLSGLVLVLGSFAPASLARADGPLEGDWRAGPMRIEVTVQSWGTDCGPRPTSTTVPGGRTVHVTQSGDDLTFGGRPARSTTGCWSENTAVRRVSRSYEGGTWRITCRTPPEDPRAETGQYTLRTVGTERIEFRDESRYDWQLNESRCQATMTSTQTFERVSSAATPEPEPTPTPTPTPTPEPPEPACTPGAPARIVLRSPREEVEPGGRVCLTARVVDSAGCTVRSERPTLRLEAPSGRRGSLSGTCFEAASSAAEAEGTFTIVARSGSFEAHETIVVRTPDLSDLIARRAEGGGAVPRDDQSAEAEEAARVAARTAGGGGFPWLALVGAVVGLVLVIGASLGLVLRGRRKRPAPSSSFDDDLSAPAPVAPLAPPPQAAPTPVPVGENMICPSCRQGYPPGATTCSRDGTALVPYSQFASAPAAASIVCPTCGERYAVGTRFCGKDGTVLS